MVKIDQNKSFSFTDGVKHRINSEISETVSNSKLEILLVENVDNFASYTCVGLNSEGTAQDTVRVKVLEKKPNYATKVKTSIQVWEEKEGKSKGCVIFNLEKGPNC